MITFLVGEIAILCNSTAHPEYNGMDCEVVSGLHLRESPRHPGTLFVRHLVRAADGRRFAVAPDSLRKKPRALGPELAARLLALEVLHRVSNPEWSPA